jgi:hypothetical protein
MLKRLINKKPTISTNKILNEYKKADEIKKRISRFNSFNLEDKLNENQ